MCLVDGKQLVERLELADIVAPAAPPAGLSIASASIADPFVLLQLSDGLVRCSATGSGQQCLCIHGWGGDLLQDAAAGASEIAPMFVSISSIMRLRVIMRVRRLIELIAPLRWWCCKRIL